MELRNYPADAAEVEAYNVLAKKVHEYLYENHEELAATEQWDISKEISLIPMAEVTYPDDYESLQMLIDMAQRIFALGYQAGKEAQCPE